MPPSCTRLWEFERGKSQVGAPTKGGQDAYMFDRLPLQIQRGSKTPSQALPVPDDATDTLYRASYANFVSMVEMFNDNGIAISTKAILASALT